MASVSSTRVENPDGFCLLDSTTEALALFSRLTQHYQGFGAKLLPIQLTHAEVVAHLPLTVGRLRLLDGQRMTRMGRDCRLVVASCPDPVTGLTLFSLGARLGARRAPRWLLRLRAWRPGAGYGSLDLPVTTVYHAEQARVGLDLFVPLDESKRDRSILAADLGRYLVASPTPGAEPIPLPACLLMPRFAPTPWERAYMRELFARLLDASLAPDVARLALEYAMGIAAPGPTDEPDRFCF